MATVNLRAFPYPQEVDCPHCHKPITLYDPDGSEYVVCGGCHFYSRFIATRHLQAQHALSPLHVSGVLEIGKEGNLNGLPYKVLAIFEKKESSTHYKWREYMLYNYSKGYAFLAEFNGHWSFIAGIEHFPEVAKALLEENTAELDGAIYHEYNRYSPVIVGLTGEFDWDAYEERILTREFVRPPYILVREKNKKNEQIIDWYFGEYIEPGEIAAAFNIAIGKFPVKIDTGANQPNPHKKRWYQALTISLVGVALIIGLQLFLGATRQTQVILDKSVDLSLPPQPVPDSTKHDTSLAATANLFGTSTNGTVEFQPLRTSSFSIFSGPAPVEIELTAPVDNNWMEATVELVNEKDNKTWDVTKALEYYHGYEDGESWSEGSNNESVTVDDIPPGKYHINIYAAAGTQSVIAEMGIKVTANIMLWQNIMISVLLLCIYPLVCWYRQRQFEVNRWMSSDFSPYKTTTSDD